MDENKGVAWRARRGSLSSLLISGLLLGLLLVALPILRLWFWDGFHGVAGLSIFGSQPRVMVHPSAIALDRIERLCRDEFKVPVEALYDEVMEHELNRLLSREYWADFSERGHGLKRRKLACIIYRLKHMYPDNARDPNVTIALPDNVADQAFQNLRSVAAIYFQKWIELARQKKQLMYLHHTVHAGGVKVCDQAWLNGCRSPGTVIDDQNTSDLADGVNCASWKFFDNAIWKPGLTRPSGREYTCGTRLSFAEQAGFNFMANEGYLTDAHPTCQDSILSVNLIRDPKKRMLDVILDVLQNHPEWVPEHCLPHGTNLQSFEHVRDRLRLLNLTCWSNPTLFDSPMTRSLGGREVFERTKVSWDDVARAKTALKMFDVLLMMGEQHEANLFSDITKVGMGLPWRFTTSQSMASHEYALPGESTDFNKMFSSRNAIDMELYQYARDLYSLDSLVYTAARAFCQSPIEAARKLQYSAACEAFLSVHDEKSEVQDWNVAKKGHREVQMRQRRARKAKFACGCGWVGSGVQANEIPEQYAASMGFPRTDTCPRNRLFSQFY